MAYGILLTSLYAREGNEKIKYYHAIDGSRMYYCDAMLPGEASSKYILANYHIDEIITTGSKDTYDSEEEIKDSVISDGKALYESDLESLSSFSLLKYRLAEYLDEVNHEKQGIIDLLDTEEQKKLMSFMKKFFEEKINKDGTFKANRYFHYLAINEKLLEEFMNDLMQEIPEANDKKKRFAAWVQCFLFEQLKDSFKFELRDWNANAKVRFIPTSLFGGESFRPGNIQPLINAISRNGEEEVDLYISIHSDDATDTFLIMNMLELIKGMPDSKVNVKAIITTSNSPKKFCEKILNDTENYDITDLMTGFRSFIDYGKVDRLIEYWNGLDYNNPYIQSVLYAVRDVDNSVSLCDIVNIQKAITKIRELISKAEYNLPDDSHCRLFRIILDGIRKDYGEMLEGEELNFISMVKWAYHKKFYQQTLTIIESLAPNNLVDRGIFYYCDSEEEKQKVISILGEYYAELKPFEKWKLDNISHYFIKNFGRGKTPRGGSIQQQQKAFAEYRVSTIGSDDPAVLAGYSLCEDREALTNLLFSYYYIGAVRNYLNHADTRTIGDDPLMATEADLITRMKLVRDTIEFFIHSYDIVDEEIKDKTPHVVYVDHADVAAYGTALFQEQRKKRDEQRRDDQRRDDQRRDDHNQRRDDHREQKNN
jgi:hypothetical protein